MAQYGYAIAVGSNQTNLTNMEDIFLNIMNGIPIAPVGEPIPLGSVQRVTLDQHRQTNGTPIVRWRIGAASWTDFERFVLAIWGSWDTESVDVTIDTRGRDEMFHRGNAVALLPLSGIDYQRRDHGSVEDLVITFRDFQEATSAFSIGHSLGHKA